MNKAKAVCSPFAGHLKLTSKQCPKSEKDMKEMNKVPYASSVGSLMYAMICVVFCDPNLFLGLCRT